MLIYAVMLYELIALKSNIVETKQTLPTVRVCEQARLFTAVDKLGWMRRRSLSWSNKRIDWLKINCLLCDKRVTNSRVV